MTRTMMIFGAATAALLAGAAQAQTPDRGRDRPGFGGPRGGDLTLLRAADADGNGVATRAEVEALRAEEFAFRDRNGDGALDRADLGPLATRVAQLRSADPWAPGRGPRADGDGDGHQRVTREEFASRTDGLFTWLDTDGDGGISAAEAQAARGDRADRGSRRDGRIFRR